MAKEEKKKRGGSFIKKLDFAGIFTKDKDKDGSESKSPRGSRRSLNFSNGTDKLPERSESPSKKKITVSQTKPRSNTLDGTGPPSALSLSTGALFGKGQTVDSVIGEDEELSLTDRDETNRRTSLTPVISRSPRKLSDLLRKSKKKTVTSDFKKIEDVKSHTQPLLNVSGLVSVHALIVPSRVLTIDAEGQADDRTCTWLLHRRAARTNAKDVQIARVPALVRLPAIFLHHR